jgi:O-antigen/teichoic acid export membrane protein
VGKGIRVIDQLLLVPFFLANWGPEYYGEWLTLTIIPSMLSFSELGFGSAAANTLVLRYASGDKQGAANIGKSGFVIITFMVVVACFLSVLVLGVLWKSGIFEDLVIDEKEALVAVSILMASRLLNFYHQYYEAHYRAARKAALSMNLLSSYRALRIVMALIVLLSGKGIIALALTDLAVSIIFLPVFAGLARRNLPLHNSYIPNFLKEDVKEIVGKGLGFFLFPVWQAIYFQGTTLVVRIVLGPTAVAVFNTVRTASRSVNQMFSMVNSSIFPEVQFELGAGNMERARKITRMASGVVFFVALTGVVFLYFFGPELYEWWTQDALNPPPLMWNIFIFGILFSAVWDTLSVIFRALNRPYELALALIIGSLLSVILSYFLAISYGLPGAAFGTVLLDVLMAFYVLPKSCKLIKQPLSNLFKSTYKDFTELIDRKAKVGHSK